MPQPSGLAFSDAALRFLATVPKKLRSQIVRKAQALEAHPHPVGSKALNGYTTPLGEQVYRERSGDYRILYVIRKNPGHVLILDIDHRKDIYR